MSHLAYSVLNLVILASPFIGMLFVKAKGIREILERFAYSFLFAFIPFIIWDFYAVYKGHWTFNPEYIVGIHLFLLPIEEVLFFVTIPLSCILLYEFIKTFKKDFEIPHLQKIFFILGIAFAILAFFVQLKEYSLLVCVFISITLFFASYKKTILSSGRFLLFLGFSFILFFITNTILTSLPIVIYSPLATTEIKIGTIPIEDFGFSLLMLFLYIQSFESAQPLTLVDKKENS